jgi:hypothetical protein
MTRSEIIAAYVIRRGTIVSPGRFEGQPVFAPYYYEALLSGLADEENDDAAVFDVLQEDVAEFPELASFEKVFLSEDEQGFISCVTL